MSITSRSPMNCQSFSLGARWHSAWLGSVPWRLERRRNPAVSARGRSNGVLRRVKRPIGCGPSGMGRVLSPLVAVPSGTSKTYRSLLLAVSRSTINIPSECMILKIRLFCDHRVFAKALPHSLTRQRDQDQIQDSAVVGTDCHLQNA
jgi:hypothetical protein